MAKKFIVALVLFTLLVGLPFATPAADAPSESQETKTVAAGAPGTQEAAGAAAATAPTKQETGGAAAANAPGKQDASAAEGSNEAIGNDDDSSKGGQGFAEAAPAGGPVPEGTFADTPTTDTTSSTTSSPSKSGATTLEVSTVLATMAGFSLFKF